MMFKVSGNEGAKSQEGGLHRCGLEFSAFMLSVWLHKTLIGKVNTSEIRIGVICIDGIPRMNGLPEIR